MVEWAKEVKLINYRFHAENKTHSIVLVIQYLTETEEYKIVTENVK